jgi:retron-type reverse transcriptase
MVNGNVAKDEVQELLSKRLANLKRLYAIDGKMSRYHKIKEIEFIMNKLKELNGARRFEPHHQVLPTVNQRSVSA